MENKKLFQEIEENIKAVISKETPLGISLWEALLNVHHVDTADFLGTISRDYAKKLYLDMPKELKIEIFEEISDPIKVFFLNLMDDHERGEVLNRLPVDMLTDLFDQLSDVELKNYLNLLHKKEREKVLALLQFEPDSAGGIMDIEVFSLMEDFTVEHCIRILQRLQPNRDVYQQIYVTNRLHKLEGYIRLEDLVLHKPQEKVSSFMKEVEMVARATDDQETVSKKMVHYNLMTAPVVDDNNMFLGVIPGGTLVDVIVQEASEDVQKMAAVPPLKYPYFEMSFFKLLYQRSYVLVALFIAESFSGPILRSYEGVLTAILISFLPTLTAAGGNAGSQASAVVIQGLASGEFGFSNMIRLLRRELTIAGSISVLLGIISFFRVYFIGGQVMECLSVSGTLCLTIFISAMLGTTIPFLLRRLRIDPAFLAGPFLATVMDILGILIYCHLSKMLLMR